MRHLKTLAAALGIVVALMLTDASMVARMRNRGAVLTRRVAVSDSREHPTSDADSLRASRGLPLPFLARVHDIDQGR
jgi:hypothetical protein